MKIGLLGAGVGGRTSGQSRFLMNLAVGLRRASAEVAVTAASIRPEARAVFEGSGITATDLGERPDRASAQAKLVASSSRLGRRIARAALEGGPCDWYVVIADGLLDAIEVLPPSRSAYLSQGDLSLMFLSPPFYRTHPLAKRWVARDLARAVLQNAQRARRFRVLLANSEFTRHVMSYLYGVTFQDRIYPPVDLERFRPSSSPPGRYAVAVARNVNEQGLELLRELAQELPIHVVGGASVEGTADLGEVSDEQMARELAGATVTLAPVVSELFGYSVAESLACGTPVLAFDCGGPSEQVRPGWNGWLARSPAEFVAMARAAFSSGYPSEWHQHARESATKFGLQVSAERLLEALRQAAPSSVPVGTVR